jgi:chaperonin cofactor prefoldin
VRTIARAFNRSLFGYRRKDVDDALARRDSAIEEETKRARAEMARADTATLRISQEAARADQAVVRAGGLERASLNLAGRVSALEQVADRLALRVAERERAIVKLTERLEATLETLREAEAGAAAPDAPSVEANGAGGADEAADIFAGLIEVEVGPLSDFEQLASFEDAAMEIREARQISVKRFTEGRATLEMDLSEPVALLSELETRAPFDFTVRDTREDRVVLDVDAQ